jgi:hypothetical protein
VPQAALRIELTRIDQTGAVELYDEAVVGCETRQAGCSVKINNAKIDVCPGRKPGSK